MIKLKNREEYLSLQNTTALKGILAICVVLCHLWGAVVVANPNLASGTIGNTIGRILTVFGYLSVAVFLFLSGYGLSAQYNKKGDEYLKGFLLKRVLPLYLINILLVLFYLLARLAFDERVGYISIIKSFIFGETIVKNGWYLQTILLWYLIFYIVFRCVKKENLQMALLFVAFILYVALCYVLDLSSTWYEGALCLPLGVVACKYIEKIDKIISEAKKYIFTLLCVTLLFGITFICGNFSFLNFPLRVSAKILSAVFFSILVVLILKIIPIKNKITTFLGKISLEIYVIHGFFILLYASRFVYISNIFVYCILVFVSSILMAWMIHPLFSFILNKFKK